MSIARLPGPLKPDNGYLIPLGKGTALERVLLPTVAIAIWAATLVISRSGALKTEFGPYAAIGEMVEGFTLKGGDELTRLSPLFPALAWLPYALSSNVVASLDSVNAVAMGMLVFGACALCERYTSSRWAKAAIAVNIPLLAFFSKMTAFVPADPSLCAATALMCATAAGQANRYGAQLVAQVAAVTLSPIGIAAPLSGMLRGFRLRVEPRWIAMLYAPPVAIWCVVQWWARGGVAGAIADFMPARAFASLGLWREPVFVTLCASMAVTAAGGLILPLVRRPSCVRHLWQEIPELFVLLGAVCLNAVSTGSATVWGFLLPMYVLLWAASQRTLSDREARFWFLAATAVTLFTQIPFAYSSVDAYEATVHPYALYRMIAATTASVFLRPWVARISMLVVVLVSLASAYLVGLDRINTRMEERNRRRTIDAHLSSALVLLALGFVLRGDRGPAVDENVHLDQILRFARGDWTINQALAMLPGFHLLVAALVFAFGATAASIRIVVFGLAMATVVVFYVLARDVDPRSAGTRTLQFALMPVLFHQFFLIYTDVTSLLVVLVMMLLAVRGRYVAAGALGVVAIAVRQDNVVWVAFALAWSHVRDYGWRWPAPSEWIARYATFVVSGCAFVLFVLANHGQIALGYDAGSHPTGLYGGNVFFMLFLSGFVFAPLWWSYRGVLLPRARQWWLWLGIAGLLAAYWLGFMVDHPHNLERSDYFLANAVLTTITSTGVRRMLGFLPVVVGAAGFAIAPMKRGWWLLLPFSMLFLLPEWLIVPRYYLIPWALFSIAREAVPPASERLQTLVFGALSACAFVVVNGGWGWI